MASREEILAFRALVDERLGLGLDEDKLDPLGELLEERMRQLALSRPSEYLKRLSALSGSGSEWRLIAQAFTVGETYFFRHPEHFRVFCEVALPERLARLAEGQSLRLLSAGCASGEEAYTLAILVHQQAAALGPREVSITGVDLNNASLEKARAARYSAWSLRDVPDHMRQRYFRPQGREFFLDPQIRSMVAFEERNLVQEDPRFWQPEWFDVVFCRNVIMYWTPEAARAVIARMARALAPGGFLFLGPAETLRGVSQAFHLRHTRETFYYQRRAARESRRCGFTTQIAEPSSTVGAALASPLALDGSWIGNIGRSTQRISRLARKAGTQGPPLDTSLPGEQIRPEGGTWPPWDLSLARELLSQERLAEALEALRALPPEAQAHADVLLLRAVILANRGQVAAAERACREVLALDELNAGAHYLAALCQEHLGEPKAAMELDQTAIYLDPNFAMPYLHLGLLCKRSEDTGLARRELVQALALLPREKPSRILLFGGGFSREALMQLCRAELRGLGGAP